MPKVNFRGADGQVETVEIAVGTSVMRGAKDAGIDGIDGDCGGVCACATCHVYVASEWMNRVGKPSAEELEMLDCANDPRPESRLSCQIEVTDALDGLNVQLPESQR